MCIRDRVESGAPGINPVSVSVNHLVIVIRHDIGRFLPLAIAQDQGANQERFDGVARHWRNGLGQGFDPDFGSQLQQGNFLPLGDGQLWFAVGVMAELQHIARINPVRVAELRVLPPDFAPLPGIFEKPPGDAPQGVARNDRVKMCIRDSLLQCGGGEWRGRVAFALLALNLGDA